MSRYGDQDVKCPFYKNFETRGRVGIRCEGVFSEAVWHQFQRRKEMDDHMEQYCCTWNFYLCPHAAAVEKKYEEE